MKKRISVTGLLLISVALVGLVGCTAGTGGTSSNDQPHTGGAPASGVPVTIQNFAFNPRSITVKVGDTVTWTNKDSTTHTVTGTGFVSGELAPGETYSHRFNAAGTYQYICSIHATMEGIVVVQ